MVKTFILKLIGSKTKWIKVTFILVNNVMKTDLKMEKQQSEIDTSLEPSLNTKWGKKKIFHVIRTGINVSTELSPLDWTEGYANHIFPNEETKSRWKFT